MLLLFISLTLLIPIINPAETQIKTPKIFLAFNFCFNTILPSIAPVAGVNDAIGIIIGPDICNAVIYAVPAIGAPIIAAITIFFPCFVLRASKTSLNFLFFMIIIHAQIALIESFKAVPNAPTIYMTANF